MTDQGGWAPPPPPPAYGYWAPPAGPKTESLATTSLVFGLVSFVFLPVIFGVVAIVTGIQAKKAIDRSGGTRTGRSKATAGEALGIVNVIVYPVLIFLVVALILKVRDTTEYTNLQPGACYQSVGGRLLHTVVQPISCAKAHDAEVIGGFDATDPGHDPGPAGFRLQAIPECSRLAALYLGTAPSEGLQLSWLEPNQALWESGAHTVECGLENAGGTKHTGSVRG
jgi:Domain of unknown function (DUF4190)/Septum formation